MKGIKIKANYNLRQVLPILGIAGMTMFASCGKDDEPEIIKHDTVYQFHRGNLNYLDTLQIMRSADSAQVRNIIFKVHPNATWDGYNMKMADAALDIVFRVARNKGVASGTFVDVTDTSHMEEVERIKARGYGIEWRQNQR